MDIIFIDDLRITTRVGIYPREQALPQGIEINLRIGRSTTIASQSDEIDDTIDYAKVVNCLRDELAKQHFNLLEKMAEYIAELILQRFAADWVQVSVAKVGIVRGAGRVGVVIERQAAP